MTTCCRRYTGPPQRPVLDADAADAVEVPLPPNCILHNPRLRRPLPPPPAPKPDRRAEHAAAPLAHGRGDEQGRGTEPWRTPSILRRTGWRRRTYITLPPSLPPSRSKTTDIVAPCGFELITGGKAVYDRSFEAEVKGGND